MINVLKKRLQKVIVVFVVFFVFCVSGSTAFAQVASPGILQLTLAPTASLNNDEANIFVSDVNAVGKPPTPIQATGFPVTLKLPPASYRLQVVKPGWMIFDKQVTIQAGQNVFVEVPGIPSIVKTVGNPARVRSSVSTEGYLFVVSPPGATVSVDGQNAVLADQVLTIQPVSVDHRIALSMQCPGSSNEEVRTWDVRIEPGQYKVLSGDCGTNALKNWGILKLSAKTPVLPGLELSIDGQFYPPDLAFSSLGVPRPPGNYTISIRKPGGGAVEVKGKLAPFETKSVVLPTLEAQGSVVLNTYPQGSKVVIDGKAQLDVTPLVVRLPPGTHQVSFQKDLYQPLEREVVVSDGATASLTGVLQKAKFVIDTKPEETQRNMSTTSAVALGKGQWALDLQGGGPSYFAYTRLTVGVYRTPDGEQGIDFRAGFKTNGLDNTFFGSLHAQLLQVGPILFGLEVKGGGGVGPRGRNTGFAEASVPVTFLAGNIVKLTAAAFMQVYSDRYCPSQESILEEIGRDKNGNLDPKGIETVKQKYDAKTMAEHAGDRCLGRGYNPDAPGSTVMNPIGFPNPIAAVADGTYNPNNPLYQVGGTPILDRFVGARFGMRFALEVAPKPWLNLFVIGEVFPGTERLLFTDAFNRAYPEKDPAFSVFGGITLKFMAAASK